MSKEPTEEEVQEFYLEAVSGKEEELHQETIDAAVMSEETAYCRGFDNGVKAEKEQIIKKIKDYAICDMQTSELKGYFLTPEQLEAIKKSE